jgi:hypothetical protein
LVPFTPAKRIGFALLVCASVLGAGACGSQGNAPTGIASGAVSLNGLKSPVAEPTFTYPGDRQCRITYRDNGNGTMSWTANVTVAGELITHASDSSGNIYRHDEQVPIGLNTFTAPVPLSRITDIGGVLYVPNNSSSTSYGCSVRPQHSVAKKAKAKPRRTAAPATSQAVAPPTTAPAAAPTTSSGCYPLTNGGNCYEPGEYCRNSDHGMSGVAGDGEKIICEDKRMSRPS